MVVITRGGSDSGVSSGAKLIHEKIRECIMSDVRQGILDVTCVMFVMIKEGNMELLDECLRAFCAEMVTSHFMAYAHTIMEFNACGAPEFFRKKDAIANDGLKMWRVLNG